MKRLTLPHATHAPAAVLVVGSVAYDDIITPRASGERILGGSASYAALAASYFAPTRLVGVVGHDFAPHDLARLRARGIDLEGLQVDQTGPTFHWKGRYHENFNRRDTLEIHLNVFERFRPQLPEIYKQSEYALLGNIHPALQRHVRGALGKNVFAAADTIDLWIKTTHEELLALLLELDLFVINDTEAEILTGESNLIRAGHALRAKGPRIVIIKKGEHGAYLFHPDGLFALPAYPVVELNDPTGAGDSFAGALLGALAILTGAGKPPKPTFAQIKEAMVFATVVASLTVEAFSCDRLESAGVAEIEKRAHELRAMVRL
ncbi:MAG TPA: PfkB family carbohydrate kinase [Opitutales bacterium]|jgi:sugar/nucleoside kinase (ribokinase family)|nr:PfkB family carbohydrate kinase [Opitutales bacterium]